MKVRHLKLASRLVLLSILLTALCTFVVQADDITYFNGLLACDGNYTTELNDCRDDPNYPNDPDESTCRYQAGSEYSDCVFGLDEPSYEPDFCDAARAARDNCLLHYGPGGITPHMTTYMECWAASGVDQCE